MAHLELKALLAAHARHEELAGTVRRVVNALPAGVPTRPMRMFGDHLRAAKVRVVPVARGTWLNQMLSKTRGTPGERA